MWNPIKIRTIAAAAASLALFTAACQPVERTQGKSGIVATYNGFQLVANLPADVTVQSVVAAADASLRDQGYTVSKSESNENDGEVVGHPMRSGDHPRVRVKAEVREGATRVVITKEPWNEEALCRGVLSRMLAKLGL